MNSLLFCSPIKLHIGRGHFTMQIDISFVNAMHSVAVLQKIIIIIITLFSKAGRHGDEYTWVGVRKAKTMTRTQKSYFSHSDKAAFTSLVYTLVLISLTFYTSNTISFQVTCHISCHFPPPPQSYILDSHGIVIKEKIFLDEFNFAARL